MNEVYMKTLQSIISIVIGILLAYALLHTSMKTPFILSMK